MIGRQKYKCARTDCPNLLTYGFFCGYCWHRLPVKLKRQIIDTHGNDELLKQANVAILESERRSARRRKRI